MSRDDPSSWTSRAPLVIAHRGACASAPENTLAAFRLAAEQGAHGVELDAKLTSDGEVVVHHDLTLERTTDGTGRLSEHTLEELKGLDAGVKFASRFKGARIPTLREVFSAVGERLLINVELTNYGSLFDDLPAQVIRLVRDFQLERRILLSSFSPVALIRARRAAPEIRRGLLILPGAARLTRWLLQALVPHDDLHPPDALLTASMIAGQHRRGGRVNVWTVNGEARILECFKLGVDGVIGDDPALALDVLQDWSRTRA